MKRIDPEIEHYRALKPREYPVLAKLEISQSEPPEVDSATVTLRIELRPDSHTDHRRLVLTFKYVRELQLTQQHSSLIYFPLLEIVSIKDRQWAYAKYKVKESEEDSLSFLCKSFTAVIDENTE